MYTNMPSKNKHRKTDKVRKYIRSIILTFKKSEFTVVHLIFSLQI